MLEAGLCYWPCFTGMEHCTPHTCAVHRATCLERKVAGRENRFQLLELLPGGFHTCSAQTNHRLLRACLLGSKRKLPLPVCQARLGLLSVVCRLRGVLFPCTVYTCNQGPLSSAWAHCTSYAPSAYSLFRRCCCCPLQCDRQHMGTFTLSPFSSIASFHVKSLLTHSSSDPAMITRSSA